MEVPLSCRRVQQPPTFIFIRVYITWQRRPQHQIKVTRKNLARNPSYKKAIWVSSTERRFNIDQRYRRTKDHGPAEDNYTFAGFWRPLLRLDFFHAFVFSVGMDVLVQICESCHSCHSFHIFVLRYWGTEVERHFHKRAPFLRNGHI